MRPRIALGNRRKGSANSAAPAQAMISAWAASAAASSRFPPPKARAMAETTPPPMAPADIWESNKVKGSTTAQPASAACPCRAASQGSINCAITWVAANKLVGAARASIWVNRALASVMRMPPKGPSRGERVRRHGPSDPPKALLTRPNRAFSTDFFNATKHRGCVSSAFSLPYLVSGRSKGVP